MSIEFNFKAYSSVLASIIIDNLEKAKKPIVIGIHGEWGSGKTTLLKEIAKEIEESNKKSLNNGQIIMPIKFNAWRFEKENHLIVPLLKTLYYELERVNLDKNSSQSGTLEKIKDGLFSIISGIEIEFEIGFAQAKYIGKESVEHAEKRYDERKKERREKSRNFAKKYESIYFDIIRQIAKLTENNNIRFLFLIDDLDRCLPENSVKMLEAIKLFLDINNCAFVMAIDKEVVELGVEYNYRDYKKINNRVPITGNEYLEKMITLPFLLPSIQKEKIRKFIVNNYQGVFHGKEDLLELFCNTVPTIPRKVIRALDLYDFKLRLNQRLNTDINKKIILIVSLIELFIPELYRYVKKEFERDRERDSETFIILINSRNNIKSNDESILNIDIEEDNVSEILRRFKDSRNKFGINSLLDYILEYDSFHQDLKSYYTFTKEF